MPSIRYSMQVLQMSQVTAHRLLGSWDFRSSSVCFLGTYAAILEADTDASMCSMVNSKVAPICGPGPRPSTQRRLFLLTVAQPPLRTSHIHLFIVQGEWWITLRGSLEELTDSPSFLLAQPGCISPSGQPCTGFCSLPLSMAAGLFQEA